MAKRKPVFHLPTAVIVLVILVALVLIVKAEPFNAVGIATAVTGGLIAIAGMEGLRQFGYHFGLWNDLTERTKVVLIGVLGFTAFIVSLGASSIFMGVWKSVVVMMWSIQLFGLSENDIPAEQTPLTLVK